MKKPPVHYDPAVKAAVMAALMTGQDTGNRIAERFGVAASAVSRWKKELQHEIPNLDEHRKVNFAHLIAECLASELAAIKARNAVFSDRNWIRKQDAAALGVLHGISYDKAIRLVEAAERASVPREPECSRN